MQFTDNDVQQSKIIAGLLNAGQFELSSRQIMEGASAIKWFSGFMKVIEENVFEITKVIEPLPEVEQTAPKKKGK